MSLPPSVLDRLTIDRRFNGPPGSGNGGYVAGRLAGLMLAHRGEPTGAVEVTLRQPPPLDTPLQVSIDGDGLRATFGGVVVAEVQAVDPLDVDAVTPVSYDEALAAGRAYPGPGGHPFPTCFVCGPDREASDGLGLRPGRLADQPEVTAAAWTPTELSPELVWAALDCPGGWTLDLAGRPAVLGRLSAALDVLPAVGEPCVVMGRRLHRDGRKTATTTTLYDAEGRICARAAATWIDLPSG